MDNLLCSITLYEAISSQSFLISTSLRSLDTHKATKKFLRKRFKKNRFKFLFPKSFSKLPPISKIQPIGGNIYICDIDINKNYFKIIGKITLSYDKPQFSIIEKNILWILGVSSIAAFNIANLELGQTTLLKPTKFIQDRLLAGTHTFEIFDDLIYVTSSGCEGILVFDKINSKFLEKYLFKGYRFIRSYVVFDFVDLRKNYINNEYQKFHLNSCSKFGNKLFFTTLSGFIGFFNLDTKKAKIIAKGFTGIHFIKYDKISGHLHFIDSPKGIFYCMTLEGEIISNRKIDSNWVQSAITVNNCNEIIYLDSYNKCIVLELTSAGSTIQTYYPLNLNISEIPVFIGSVTI